MNERIEELALELPCPYCGAEPGVWCVVVASGNRAQYMHQGRSYEVWQAYGYGYEDGRRDGQYLAERRAAAAVSA